MVPDSALPDPYAMSRSVSFFPYRGYGYSLPLFTTREEDFLRWRQPFRLADTEIFFQDRSAPAPGGRFLRVRGLGVTVGMVFGRRAFNSRQLSSRRDGHRGAVLTDPGGDILPGAGRTVWYDPMASASPGDSETPLKIFTYIRSLISIPALWMMTGTSETGKLRARHRLPGDDFIPDRSGAQ